MKEDCLSEEATDQAKSQLEPSLDKSKNSVEIKDSTQFNALQAGTSAGQLPVSQINATVVLKEKAGTVESARTCFQGVMDGLFNSLGNGSNGKNGLNSNAVSDPLCIESVQIADLKVQSLVEKPSGVGEGEKGMDPDAFRVLEGVKGVLSFAFGEASLVPSGLIQSEVLIGDFSLFDKKEETSAELLNEEKRTGEVQLLEEKVVLLNSCDEIEKMDIDNGTGDVQFKEEKLISVKSSEELGQMDIDNETGDVQLKEEKTVLVNSSDETNQMDIDNETGEVQLKEENLVLVNSSDETNLMDTDNGTGEVQCKDEEQVIVKSSERTEQTETENKTGEVQFKEEKPVLVEVPEERNPSVEKREKQRNPKHDPLFVFTRRNPKRSASSSQTDLNIDRLTRISNRGRKSKKEREIEAADPKLMSSIAPNPNLATKKRNLFNRREKPSVWGRINNVEQVLQQSREFYNLKEFRDQSEKRNRALERERKEKERIAKQTVINSEAVNLERDLDSTLTHEVSNQEATQKAANGADSLEPGSSPDSVVYNPANPVAGQDGSGIKIKEEQKSDVVLINGAANPVAGRNGSVVKSKEEKKGKEVLTNGMANPVAGQNGSVVKNREEKKGKGVLPNGAANHVAGRSGSVVKNREERKSKELDEPWFYKGKKKEEKNDNADYNGVTIAYSPWMSMHNFPPPMSVLPLRSVPMVMTAKPLRSVPMPAKKPSDVPLPNPSPAPAFLVPTPPSRVRPPAYPGPAPAFLAPTPPNRLRPPANPGPAVAPASRVPDVPAYRVPAVPGYTGPAVQFYVVPAAQAKANPVPAPAKKRLAWVCCDDCGKWRCIPAELADEIGETDATWTCKENQDKRFSDCSVPQEKSNAEINAELELSDGSGDEGPAGQRPKFQETNITNPFMHGMQQFYPSSGQKPLHPAYFVPLKTNLFLHRSPKTQTIDEIMVCNCKLPKNGGMGCRSQCLNRLLSIECVKGMCPCGDLCSNQQFQRRDYSKLMWFRSGKKGFGLQSQEDVPAGRFLIEYVGEVLDMPTYEARQREYAARGQKHFYFMTLNGGEVIDAFAKGNLGRFINHSCDPNCRTEKWIVNGEVCIGLFAIRDIKQGEELTFDYNYVRVFGAAAKKCFCGSKICRGYLGGDPSSTELVVQADSDEEEDYIHQSVMPFQPVMPPQPVINQSVMIKPVMPQPVVSQPVVVGPVMIKPVMIKPVGVKPVVIKPPVMIKPVVSQPVGVKPVVIKPPVMSQHVMRKLDPNPQPVINYQAERISSLQKYIVSEDREDLTGSKLKPDKAVIQQVKPIRDFKSENREELNGLKPVSVGNGKSENREEVNGLKPVSVGNGSESVESEEASRRLDGEVDKKKDLNRPFSSSSAGLPPYDFLSFERIGNAQSENCTASKEEERMDRIKSSSILLATTQSKNLSVNREDDRMDRDDSSILLATSQSKNLSVNREDDRMDRDDPSILLATSQSENRSVSRETEGTKRVNSPVLLNTSQSENCAVNTEDVSIPVLDLNCSENSEDISVPNLPEAPVKSEEGKEEEIEKTPVRVTRSSKRLNSTNIDKTDITPGSNKTDVKPGSDKKASDDSKPKRARLVRNSEKLSNQMNEMKKREVRRDLFHEEKNVSRNTDDDDFFEGVEERLNKLLDADGGISRRKDATMGYLKLLIVTAAAGDTGTTQRLRDLSLILDALLKTKSRTVLTDIMSKNGLHMLHTILKQNRDNFNRIPILRKLLKVLDFLAEKEILTLEQMNRGPPCPGAESFRDSIYKLIKHQNNLVHRAAREFFNKWMPKNMRVKEPSFINPLKRKDRWDPPSQNPNFPSPFPNFISQNPNFTKRYNPVPSPAKKLCTQNPNSQNDDAPPGFGPSGKTVIIEPSPPVQLPAGERQERYRAGTSVSYGIPAGTAQSLSTFIQSQVGVIWGIAPSIPFKPFPPLPQNPRVLEESEKRREKESYVNREYKDDRRRRRYEPYSSNSNLKSSNSNSNSNLDLESGSSRRPRVSRWDKDEKYERKNKYDNYDNDGDKKGVSRASSWPKWPREER